MRFMIFSLPPFLLVAVPVVVVAGIIFRKRRRLPWYSDAAMLVPFCVWAAVIGLADGGKSLANLFREPLLLGILVGLSSAAGLAWPTSDRDVALRRLVLSAGICCIAAAALAMWYPILPE